MPVFSLAGKILLGLLFRWIMGLDGVCLFGFGEEEEASKIGDAGAMRESVGKKVRKREKMQVRRTECFLKNKTAQIKKTTICTTNSQIGWSERRTKC